MRLDKLLSESGYGSRKDVKKVLKKGRITVDGHVVKDGKVKVDPSRQTIFNGNTCVKYQQHVYLMLNKPSGVISATEDPKQQTVIDLIAAEWGHKKMFPIGRLDKDTTGLLLLTTDGTYAHALMAPKRHVAKRYRAVIAGEVGENERKQFAEGILLGDGYMTRPSSLSIIESGPKSVIELVLTEGKFHQVKRMFAACGKQVIALERTHIGELALDLALASGAYRELTEEEKHLAVSSAKT
ncbi:pseudouridine synthase [Shouchella lonarensis]|uniref:Pseudouridine synthase n=1 Tax=Shouchella lonarensis TaxID=1464122 RepID=A0A1G6GH95_9BACI|nr:pseudouridine synthase [Shouchella lonarensis]SDB81125.1 ribosomal small subunit pseudouridine synthase A [Shouchella lonarensis]